MYAQETITSSVTGKDGVTYYVVSGTGDNTAFDDAGVLDVTAELGFGTTNTASLLIRYDFGSMVLTEGSNPALTVDPIRGCHYDDTPREAKPKITTWYFWFQVELRLETAQMIYS